MILIRATVLSASLLLAQEAPPAPDAFLDNGVVAEGGNSQAFPENTLPAIQSALDLGVAWIQVQVQLTKDGQLVVIAPWHAISQEKAIAERTLEEVQALDVAESFRQAKRRTVETCPPQQAPSLAEVLDLIQAQDRTRLLITPFPDILTELCALLDEREATPWVGLLSGSAEWLAKARDWNADVPRFWQRPITTQDEASLEEAKDLGLTALVFKHDGIEGERVPTLHAAGMKVGAFSIPSFMRMEFLAKAGVDYFFVANVRHMLLVLKQQEAKGSGESP